MRSVRVHFGGNEGGGDLYDPVFGLTSPGAFYALAYEHYLADYGLGGKADGLGEVSLAIREHASMNPGGGDAEPARPAIISGLAVRGAARSASSTTAS